MAVITRWPYKLDGGKAELQCNYEIYVTTRQHMVIFTVVKERQSPAFWLIWMASGLMRTENFLYKMWIMNDLPTSEPISDLEVRTIVCGSSKDNCQIVWKTLTFETRPSAKPFLWQWVSFTWQKKKTIFLSVALHVASPWSKGLRQVRNGLLYILMSLVPFSLFFRKRKDRRLLADHERLRACLRGGGGPQVGEVTRFGGVNRLSV